MFSKYAALLVAFLLGTGCTNKIVGSSHEVPTSSVITAEETPDNSSRWVPNAMKESAHWQHVITSADIVIDTRDHWEEMNAVKPKLSGTFRISKLDNIISDRSVQKRDMAVILVPYFGRLVFDLSQKSELEIAIALNNELRGFGFKEVVFLTAEHGVLWRKAYPSGLPTAAEALKDKIASVRRNQLATNNSPANEPK